MLLASRDVPPIATEASNDLAGHVAHRNVRPPKPAGARPGKDKRPLRAFCWGATQVHLIEAEDHAIGLVEYEGGAVSQFEVSWTFRAGMDLRDEVSGTEGSIRLDHFLRTGFEMFTAAGEGGYVGEKAEGQTGWLLWVFTHRDLTVYTIRANRSSDVVLDILGDHFSGILTSDGLLSYDDRRLKDWLKQKCLSHLLKDLKEMNETKTGRALHFARQASALLQEALALKREKPSLSSRTFSQRAQSLEDRLDRLIASSRRFSDPDNARFAKRLRKHRPHLIALPVCR